jgi:hypothetical protein
MPLNLTSGVLIYQLCSESHHLASETAVTEERFNKVLELENIGNILFGKNIGTREFSFANEDRHAIAPFD